MSKSKAVRNNQKRRRLERNRKVINLSLPDKKALDYVLHGHKAYNYIKQNQGQAPVTFADYLFLALMQNSEALIKMANEIADKHREKAEKAAEANKEMAEEKKGE